MRSNSHPPRSLLTSERSASSSGRSSSSSHTSSNQKSRSRRMKCIISLGLILPALAAVIGVVAWAVSAEAVWGPPGSNAGKLQGSYDLNHGHGGYEIPVLQERSDLGFNPKSVLTVQVANDDSQTRVISRDDPGIGPDNTLPSDLSSDASDVQGQPSAENPPPDSKDDPLYYVHFVPTKDSPVASSTPSSTSVSDLLSKIMSTSGGGKKGAPQFVVFAPMPDGLAAAAAKDANKKGKKEKVKYDEEEEEDEEEERRVVRKKKKMRKPEAPVHEYVHASGNGRTLGPQRTGDPSYASQSNQQYYPPQPSQQTQQSQRNYGGSTSSYAYSDGHQTQQHQQQQPQPPPYSSSGTNEAQAASDSDRLGLISGGIGLGGHHGHGHGKGLSISVGGGHGALPLSPLGLLKHLFVPILPKPRVNLNGKVVFGVVLEKGVGFGGGKPAVIYRK